MWQRVQLDLRVPLKAMKEGGGSACIALGRCKGALPEKIIEIAAVARDKWSQKRGQAGLKELRAHSVSHYFNVAFDAIRLRPVRHPGERISSL